MLELIFCEVFCFSFVLGFMKGFCWFGSIGFRLCLDA